MNGDGGNMRREWQSAAHQLLAEAGHDSAPDSAFELARDLGLDVVEADLGGPSQLVGVPPMIVVHPELSRARQEVRVAVELGTWALRRAGLPETELGAHVVAGRLVAARPRVVFIGSCASPLPVCSNLSG